MRNSKHRIIALRPQGVAQQLHGARLRTKAHGFQGAGAATATLTEPLLLAAPLLPSFERTLPPQPAVVIPMQLCGSGRLDSLPQALHSYATRGSVVVVGERWTEIFIQPVPRSCRTVGPYPSPLGSSFFFSFSFSCYFSFSFSFSSHSSECPCPSPH